MYLPEAKLNVNLNLVMSSYVCDVLYSAGCVLCQAVCKYVSFGIIL